MNVQERVEHFAKMPLPEFRQLTQSFGSFRYVYVCDGVAYKRANHPDSIRDNVDEWNLYNYVGPEVQRHMARPLAISSCQNVIAMEAVSEVCGVHGMPLSYEVAHFIDLIIPLLAEYMDFEDAERFVSDIHMGNMGMLDGELKWIDYGDHPFGWKWDT